MLEAYEKKNLKNNLIKQYFMQYQFKPKQAVDDK